MIKRISPLSARLVALLPWLMLLLLVSATYVFFYVVPYPGFRWRNDGRVYAVYVEGAAGQQLQADDRLRQVGSVPWELFRRNLRLRLFEGSQPGEVVPLQIEREGQPMEVAWRFPGPTEAERRDRFNSQWWMPYLFWLAGTLTVLLLRPRDERWGLFIAFYFLTATWLAMGSGLSHWHWGESAILMRVALWLSVPVYLHLHWIFPHPFSPLPRTLLRVGYGSALLLALLEVAQLLPTPTYLLGFVLAAAGSVLFLLAHLIRQPPERQHVGIVLLGAAVAVLPSIVQSLAQLSRPAEEVRISTSILALSALPLAYFYAAYRRQLGTLEVRANHVVSFYLFMMLLATLSMAIGMFSVTGRVAPLVHLTLIALAVAGFQPFQRFIEQRLLGMPLPSRRLLESYATRIITRLDLPSLEEVLHKDVLPTLLVRQAALFYYPKGNTRYAPPLTLGLEGEALPTPEELEALLEEAGRYRHPDLLSSAAPCPWVRLVLPLQVNEQRVGIWLLGRRDPDDFYNQREIETLQALANQTALALVNILQAQELRALYRSSAKRQEAERTRIARELHDTVLGEMAALAMRGEEQLLPQFLEKYDSLADTIRQLVSDLRPVMLMYGLPAALTSLTNRLEERLNGHGPEIRLGLGASNGRYPPEVEENLYHIVQQGCENALRHAHAQTLTISGEFSEGAIKLLVADDGVGFPARSLDLPFLAQREHFGLVGMVERAELIGARLQIDSAPGQGTSLCVTWCATQDA